MMNHYIALTGLKGNKSKNGMLGFSCSEMYRKGPVLLRGLYTTSKQCFEVQNYQATFHPKDEAAALHCLVFQKVLFFGC